MKIYLVKFSEAHKAVAECIVDEDIYKELQEFFSSSKFIADIPNDNFIQLQQMLKSSLADEVFNIVGDRENAELILSKGHIFSNIK